MHLLYNCQQPHKARPGISRLRFMLTSVSVSLCASLEMTRGEGFVLNDKRGKASFETTNEGKASFEMTNEGRASQETTRGRNGGTNELSDAVVNSNVGHVTSTLFPLSFRNVALLQLPSTFSQHFIPPVIRT